MIGLGEAYSLIHDERYTLGIIIWILTAPVHKKTDQAKFFSFSDWGF